MNEKRMPFIEHLRELRKRIIICLLAVIVGFIIAWTMHKSLFNWLMVPYENAIGSIPEKFHQALLARVPGSGVSVDLREIPVLRYRGLVEPFFVYLKVALLGGVFFAIPVIFWQLWAFIAPGLYPRERRLAGPFIIGTSVFFLAGAAFCRYVVMEPANRVLLSIGAQNTEALIMMQDYFGLMSRFLLVFGLVFELPIIIMFLAIFGLVTHRGLIKYWKLSVVLGFLLGALLTPPDPFTQVALALPLLVLYVLSIGIAYIFAKRRESRIERATAPEEVESVD